MPRQTVVRLIAGSAVVGVLAVGVALPAQAASSPAPKSGTRTDVVVPAEKTVAELAAGTVKLRLGDKGPAVSAVQTRLNTVGILVPVTGVYSDATARGVARFNEKFFDDSYMGNKVADRALWVKLKRMTNKGTGVPKVCLTKKRALCISKEQRVVRYYVKGKLVTSLDSRFGGPGNRTRNGNFKIFRKVQNDFSSLYKTPMPWSMYFSGGQAVHYSMFFNAVGYNGASHGCVNIRDKAGVIKLWKRVPIGTFTKVYG